MERHSASGYVHMTRDTPLPLYAPGHSMDDPLHSPGCVRPK